jgi:hypothetical protein
MKEKIINWLIKVTKSDTNKISDGYHTFEDLYEHRIELWIAFLNEVQNNTWKSKKHSDGSIWKGWFIAGLGKEKGEQITYHLPIKYWSKLWGADTLSKAPEFDGHTSKDVIKRLQSLYI